MKYLLVVGTVMVIYFVFVRQTPVAPVQEAVTQSEAKPLVTGPRDPVGVAVTTSIKRPIDRTHQVLDQVQRRNGRGDF